MGRKHGIFSVGSEQASIISLNKEESVKGIKVSDALEIVYEQMRTGGNRIRTIESYDYIFGKFVEFNKLDLVNEITVESIYNYLGSLEVAQQTKLIRLKSIKAVLNKFHNNGWITQKFWLDVQIKIDRQTKTGVHSNDIELLIKLIDQNTFIGFRDTVAILTMYKTGIRIQTLGGLKERHINFENLTLDLDGSILKNHKYLKLPIDSDLASLFKVLIKQNEAIRKYYSQSNTNVIITQNGLPINHSKTSNNAISKQLNKYSKRFGLKNINAHALRRGYAKNLLNAGANIAVISRALGHSDLSVTTQYLDLDIEEVADNLRKYL